MSDREEEEAEWYDCRTSDPRGFSGNLESTVEDLDTNVEYLHIQMRNMMQIIREQERRIQDLTRKIDKLDKLSHFCEYKSNTPIAPPLSKLP